MNCRFTKAAEKNAWPSRRGYLNPMQIFRSTTSSAYSCIVVHYCLDVPFVFEQYPSIGTLVRGLIWSNRPTQSYWCRLSLVRRAYDTRRLKKRTRKSKQKHNLFSDIMENTYSGRGRKCNCTVRLHGRPYRVRCCRVIQIAERKLEFVLPRF